MDEKKDIVDTSKPQWLEHMEGILETLNEGVLIADEDDHVLTSSSGGSSGEAFGRLRSLPGCDTAVPHLGR
jgi:hypothetical protein